MKGAACGGRTFTQEKGIKPGKRWYFKGVMSAHRSAEYLGGLSQLDSFTIIEIEQMRKG